MNNYSYFLIFLLLPFLGFATFENDHNHANGNQINSFKILGERCTGTKFVHELIKANFPTLVPSKKFGHKHFIPWLNAPKGVPNQLKALNFKESENFFQSSASCLFVVVVRDAYDWLRSFYRVPYHVDSSLTGDFYTFIRHPWLSIDQAMTACIVDNSNPFTGKQFSNILEMRTHKIKNYLTMGKFVGNYLIVRYEDVRDYAEEFINFIAGFYSLDKNSDFIPITQYVNHGKVWKKTFAPREYFQFDPTDLAFINSNLDWDTESLVGFYKREAVK